MLLVMAGFSPALADEASDEDAVLAVVDQFFEGLRTRDRTLWDDIMAPEGNVMVSRNKDGAWVYSHRTIEGDMDRLEGETSVLDERYFNPTVLVHETIAVVWAPYDIFVDDAFIHCGIDVFQLMKIEGAWKIVHLAYTAEPEGCEALGVGPRD